MCRASPAASFAALAQARTFFSAAWHRFSAALDRSASAAKSRESCYVAVLATNAGKSKTAPSDRKAVAHLGGHVLQL